MQFLYFLEGLRTPFLDKFFSLITHLGEETVFLAVAIIVFWCFSKYGGYYLLTAGFFGTLINQCLKLICRIPRPWVRDPNFTIVESARAEATGYSFPSGHTQSVVTALGCPARYSRNIVLRIVCIVLIALTALSRMYLGVHTPADVLVSLAVGAILVFALYPAFKNAEKNPRPMYIAMAVLVVCSAAFVLFVEFYRWPADIDPHNLESSVKNAYLLLGVSVAMLISAPVEKNCINFSTKAPFWAQVLKLVLGLGIVLGLKAGLKPPLVALFGGHHIATAIRYFILVIFAALVWPLTFKWFAKGCPTKRWVKKLIVIVIIVILVLAILGGVLFWVVTRETKAAPVSTENCTNPLITPVGVTMLSGHRAGGGIAPENTMMALKNCVESDEYQLDIFEFDIHLTADGVPVLIHDSTLDRTSDAVEHFGEEKVKVEDKTFAQLKELNMGARFENDEGEMPFADLKGEQVPDDLRIVSLDEALTYLEANGNFRYIIEVKNSGNRGCDAADILYNTLVKHDCLERTVVGTFHNEITAYVDILYPDMPRSAGFNECIRFYIHSLLGLNRKEGWPFEALQIPTDDYTVNLGTSRLINYAHKNNIAVQYWTINDPEEMAYLQSIGADAVMTDVPDVGAEILVQP